MTVRRRAGAAEGAARHPAEGFDPVTRAEVQAHERVVAAQLAAFERHFERLEAAVDRMERRLWAALAGVVAMAAAEVFRAVLALGPGG